MTTKAKQTMMTEAIETLRGQVSPGETLTSVVVHVSASGMSRAIKVLRPSRDNDGTIQDLSWLVARALGWRFSEKHDAVIVQGCGMDMCFHTVYTLASALFREQAATGTRSPGYLLTSRVL